MVGRFSRACWLICGGIAAWSASPAARAVTQDEAVSYIATCEKVWYNQAYLYKIRTARYESIDAIEKNQLISHGVKLLALANGMYVDEAITDALRDGQWRRQRELRAFNGDLGFRWSDWDNEGTVGPGSPTAVFRFPDDLQSYYGYQLDRPLSALIRDANEFRFTGTETIGENECLKADCVFLTPDSEAAKRTRFELWLATQGALFPTRLIRWVDRGDGEKMAGLWEARLIDKDPQTRIWQLREGRFYNIGPSTVHSLEVLSRRPMDAALAKPQNFTLRFPPDSKVTDLRTGKPLNTQNHRSGTVHPKNSFLPTFMGLSCEDAEARLNGAYPNNFTPRWVGDFGESAQAKK